MKSEIKKGWILFLKANNEALAEVLIEFIKTSEIIPNDKLGEPIRIVQVFSSKMRNKLKKYCRNYEEFLNVRK